MQTRPYSDLFALIKALSGVSSFTTSETTDILSFVNRRFYEAYNISRVWTRYIVIGEERVLVSPQTIPFTETSKNDISEFLRIHRQESFLNLSSREYDFYVDSSGDHILNITSSTDATAFITYKKEFVPTDGTDADPIPQEFFDFMAHASYADFLRMDGQHDKALVEEQAAGTYLANELEKVDVRMNNTTINKRFTTYVSQQAR